jgi:hypothetical protein
MSKIDRPKRRDSSAPPLPPLLSLRLLALGTASLIAGLVIGSLTWRVSGGDAGAAVLAGLTSSGLALDRLHRWTGQ